MPLTAAPLRGLARILPVILILVLAGGAAAQNEEFVIPDVPAYVWTHGCSPTAAMMLLGYWDALGYGGLVPGSNDWNRNRTAIQNAIASPEHVSEYALYDGVNDSGYTSAYLDVSSLSPGSAHENNSLADFMGTSRSADKLKYGYTFTSRIGLGISSYATWRGYSFATSGTGSTPAWDLLRLELWMGRPVMLAVDSAGSDGKLDHSVAVVGYRVVDGVQYYGCYDTWSANGIRWERFRPVGVGISWGVGGMDMLRPSGTANDRVWSGAAVGDWHEGTSWLAGEAPNIFSYAHIPAGSTVTIAQPAMANFLNPHGSLQLQSSLQTLTVHLVGDLSLETPDVLLQTDAFKATVGSHLDMAAPGELRIHRSLVFDDGAVFTAVPDSLVRVTGGAVEIRGRDEVDLAGLEHVRLLFDGSGALDGSLEVAGRDLGRSPAGFDTNFALGALALESDASVALFDAFDNGNRSSAEALYLDLLTVPAGTTLDLAGLHVYAREFLGGGDVLNGTIGSLFPGDADGNWQVDLADLALLATNWNQAGDWLSGDFTGDAFIDLADLALLASHWNEGVVGEGLLSWDQAMAAIPVPEPTAVALLSFGGVAIRVRRRRHG